MAVEQNCRCCPWDTYEEYVEWVEQLEPGDKLHYGHGEYDLTPQALAVKAGRGPTDASKKMIYNRLKGKQ
jgi:hypothetical protein